MTTDVRAAYRRCEEITWSQARNFSYGIRLLPPAKRQALAAVYAFARRIDDIGDGTLPAPEKLDPAGGGPGRAGRAARPAAPATATRCSSRWPTPRPRFDIPLAAFGELIDGCAADVRGVSYRDLRRPAALLPVRGRVDRAAVPRRVRHQRPASRRYRWPTRSASRSSSPTSCGTSARTTPAAGSTCPPRTSRGSAAPSAPIRPPIPARASSPRWWSSRRTAPAPGTPRAWR